MPIHKRSDQVRRTAILVVAVSVICAGCATSRNPVLEQARAAYERARTDANVAKFAPVPLAEAGQALRQAEQASNRDEANHLAYIAERKVDIAEAEAQGKLAESQAQKLLGDRDRLLLEQRNREVQDLQRQLAHLQAQNTERGLMITLGDVLFETGRADLKPGTRQRLSELVRFLLDHSDRQVVIEGHTDNRGSTDSNLELSQRRAEAVRAFLIRAGVDAGRISAQGYGEAYPVASNNTSAGRLQNRRVEIYLPTPGQEAVRRGT
jgi:outer membrane protein OmpA-like peptidoglycan-associated protein